MGIILTVRCNSKLALSLHLWATRPLCTAIKWLMSKETICVIIRYAHFTDSSNFVFGKRKSLMIVTTQAPNTTSITINPRIAAWNARVRNDSGNVTKSSGSSAGLKPRALFETPFNGESGGSTSLETNFLSIQSGNTKLTNGGRSFPQGFVPIGAPIIGVGSQFSLFFSTYS